MIDQRNSTEARLNRLPFFVAVLRLIVGGLSIAAAPFIVSHPIFDISAAAAATTAAMGIVAGVIITGLAVRSIYRQWAANKAIRQEQQAAESATELRPEPSRRRSRRRRRRRSIRRELGLEPENTSLERQQSESRLSSSPTGEGVRIIPRPSVSHPDQPPSRVTSVQSEASPAVNAEMEVIYDEDSPLAGAPADGKGTKPEEKKSSFLHRVAEALEFNVAKDVNSVVGFFYGQPASSPSQSPTEKSPPGVTADNPESKPLLWLDSNNPFVDNEEKTKQEEENLNLNNSIETLKYNLKLSAGNVESLFEVIKHIFEFGGRFDQHVKQHLDTQLKNKNFVQGMLECVKKREIQSSPSVRSEMTKFKELLQEKLSLLRDKLYQDKSNALQKELKVFAKYEINETQKNNEALIRHSSKVIQPLKEDKSYEQLLGEAKKKVGDHFFSQSGSGDLTVQVHQLGDDEKAKETKDKEAWLGHIEYSIRDSLVNAKDVDREIVKLLEKHKVSEEEVRSLFYKTSDAFFLREMYQILQNKGDENCPSQLASLKMYLHGRVADDYLKLILGEVSKSRTVGKIKEIVIAALQVKTPVNAIWGCFGSRLANQTFVQEMMEHLNVEGLSGQVKTDIRSLQKLFQGKWNELEKNRRELLEAQEAKRKAAKQGKGTIQDLLKNLAQIEIEKGEVYQFSADREALKITKKMSEMKPGQKTREELICDHLALAGTPASDKTRVLTDDHIVILLKKEHWEDKDLASKVKARMIEKWLEEFKQLKLETEVASKRARVIARSLCDLDVNGWTTHKVDVVKGYMEQLRPNNAHIDFLLQEKFWDDSALRLKVAQSLGFEQGESSRSSLTQTSAPTESHAFSFGSLGVATRFGFGGFFSSAKSVAKSFIAEIKDITGQTESELLESIMGCKTVDKETNKLVEEFLRSTGSLARTLDVLVEPILSGRLTRDKADCILEQVKSKWVGPDMEPACKEIRASVDVLFVLQNKGREKMEVSKEVIKIIRQKDVLDNDQIIPLLKAGYNKKKIDEDALASICNGIWDKQDADAVMQSIKRPFTSFGYARG